MRIIPVLDLLLELQALDRVPRLGYSLRGITDPESVSEHCFHLAFLVWSLAGELGELDRLRALELALVHDLAEVRTGDLPLAAAHYLPVGAKKSAERAVLTDLLAPLGEEALELVHEYAAGETREARFVRVCDKLQLMIKVAVYEGWGAQRLREFWENPANFPDGGFAPVRKLFEELATRHGPKPPDGT